jgi:hypothetical protein
MNRIIPALTLILIVVMFTNVLSAADEEKRVAAQ